MVQNLAACGAPEASVSFTPVLVPDVARHPGDLHGSAAPGRESIEQTYAAYADAYGDEPFVHLLPEASGRRPSPCSDQRRFTSRSPSITMRAGWSPSPRSTT